MSGAFRVYTLGRPFFFPGETLALLSLFLSEVKDRIIGLPSCPTYLCNERIDLQ